MPTASLSRNRPSGPNEMARFSGVDDPPRIPWPARMCPGPSARARAIAWELNFRRAVGLYRRPRRP